MSRPTTRAIAKKLGVSNATVSLALREHPRIPEKTRARIRAAAEEMGYFRDPAISKLMTRIRSTKPVGEMAKIALLNMDSVSDLSTKSPYHDALLNGMKEQGAHLGYQVESFWLKEKHMTQSRMNQILESRGIQGMIIPPIYPFGTRLKLNWKFFSVVTIGYSLLEPRFNRIVGNQRQAVFNSLQRLLETGHTRIGAVWHSAHDFRMTFIASSVFSWFHDQIPPSRHIPYLTITEQDPRNPEIIDHWLSTHKPDAIVTHDPSLHETLTSMGYNIPKDFSLITEGSVVQNASLSGYYVSPKEVGRRAVKMLDSQLMQNEFGIPTIPVTTLVYMHWAEGATVKRRGPPDPLSSRLEQTAW
jgi:LacI family transcriptional regulator